MRKRRKLIGPSSRVSSDENIWEPILTLVCPYTHSFFSPVEEARRSKQISVRILFCEMVWNNLFPCHWQSCLSPR